MDSLSPNIECHPLLYEQGMNPMSGSMVITAFNQRGHRKDSQIPNPRKGIETTSYLNSIRHKMDRQITEFGEWKAMISVPVDR
jgi:hypothetical protein